MAFILHQLNIMGFIGCLGLPRMVTYRHAMKSILHKEQTNLLSTSTVDVVGENVLYLIFLMGVILGRNNLCVLQLELS